MYTYIYNHIQYMSHTSLYQMYCLNPRLAQKCLALSSIFANSSLAKPGRDQR